MHIPPPARTLLAAFSAAAMTLRALAVPVQLEPPAAASQPDGSPPATRQPEDAGGAKNGFWQRDVLTGDWDGLRTQLGGKGITITPLYRAEVFGNLGGAAQGVVSDGLFNLELDLNLDELIGWHGAIIHANALYLYGPSLSDRYVGDFSNTSNISGYNTVRLQELWFEQDFGNGAASLRAGMLAADAEFFTADTSALFLSGTFGAFTLIGSNFTNAPLYPIASPGVRLFVQPSPRLYFRTAVFGTDSGADPVRENRHGTHFHINAGDGALLMFELGWLVNKAPEDKGLAGTYKIGSVVQRGNYHTFGSQADAALGAGSLSGKGTNYAIYAVADQELCKCGDSASISAFLRCGCAPSDLSFVDRYFDAGFNFTGFLPGRSRDIAGIALARSAISGRYSRAQQRQGSPPSTSESVIEATYEIRLAPWCSVQPDVQYIVNPSGVKGSTDAVVLGMRTTIAF